MDIQNEHMKVLWSLNLLETILSAIQISQNEEEINFFF